MALRGLPTGSCGLGRTAAARAWHHPASMTDGGNRHAQRLLVVRRAEPDKRLSQVAPVPLGPRHPHLPGNVKRAVSRDGHGRHTAATVCLDSQADKLSDVATGSRLASGVEYCRPRAKGGAKPPLDHELGAEWQAVDVVGPLNSFVWRSVLLIHRDSFERRDSLTGAANSSLSGRWRCTNCKTIAGIAIVAVCGDGIARVPPSQLLPLVKSATSVVESGQLRYYPPAFADQLSVSFPPHARESALAIWIRFYAHAIRQRCGSSVCAVAHSSVVGDSGRNAAWLCDAPPQRA